MTMTLEEPPLALDQAARAYLTDLKRHGKDGAVRLELLFPALSRMTAAAFTHRCHCWLFDTVRNVVSTVGGVMVLSQLRGAADSNVARDTLHARLDGALDALASLHVELERGLDAQELQAARLRVSAPGGAS